MVLHYHGSAFSSRLVFPPPGEHKPASVSLGGRQPIRRCPAAGYVPRPPYAQTLHWNPFCVVSSSVLVMLVDIAVEHVMHGR